MSHPDVGVGDALDDQHSAYAFRLGLLMRAVALHVDDCRDGDQRRAMLAANQAHLQQDHAQLSYNFRTALRGGRR
jgi:hypothetical protein